MNPLLKMAAGVPKVSGSNIPRGFCIILNEQQRQPYRLVPSRVTTGTGDWAKVNFPTGFELLSVRGSSVINVFTVISV